CLHDRGCIRSIIPYSQVILAFAPLALEAGPLADGLAECADFILALFVGLITFGHGTPAFHRSTLLVTTLTSPRKSGPFMLEVSRFRNDQEPADTASEHQ